MQNLMIIVLFVKFDKSGLTLRKIELVRGGAAEAKFSPGYFSLSQSRTYRTALHD